MAFRVNNSQSLSRVAEPKEVPKETRIYTQEEIDLIEEKYKKKETLLSEITKPANPAMEEYRRSLVTTKPLVKQVIVFDKATNKWKLVPETVSKENA